MDKKEPIKISLTMFLLIIAIIAIFVMGYFMYNLYKERTSTEENINNLNSQITILHDQINKKYEIKTIKSETIELELIINNSQNKRINLCLSENLDNQYYLFKDLYQKQMNLVKELNFLKEDNFKLRQENMYIKNEFMSLKNKYINEMDQIKNKITKLIIQINSINQKNFSIEEQKKRIENNLEQLMKGYNMKNNNQFIMMQQQMMNQNKRIEELNYFLKGNSISVLFKNPNGKIIPVNCYQKDLCSEMIKKYKNKDKDYHNDDNLSFLFNGKNLEENLSLSKHGITNGSQIVVIN